MSRALPWLKRLILLLLLASAGWVAFALLKGRPQDLPWTKLDLAQPVGMFTGRKLASLTDDPAECRALLARAGVMFAPRAVAGGGGGLQCDYSDGVRLSGGNGQAVLAPADVVPACPVAAALKLWEWNVVQPAALRWFGSPVARVEHLGSYSCRRLYGRTTGGMSEHATGDAIDIAGFVLRDGRRIGVLRDWQGTGDQALFLRDVRDGACKLFATTLSPDYNAAHRDHLHLDQAERGEMGWARLPVIGRKGMPPRPTPYDGSNPLFAIGMSRLNPADWIEVDSDLPAYLAEKARLERERPETVFRAEGDAAARAELLAMLVDHLTVHFPEIYRRSGRTVEIVPTERRVALDEGDPLRVAGRLVQEDLVLMRRNADGWRLAGASLSFPSSWRLADKFGQVLADIHAPVPGFGPGTDNAAMMARIFDRLPVDQPALRWNWGVHDRPDLSLIPDDGEAARSFDAAIFLRVERQTLRKLPVSGEIVFTIRIHVDPLDRLARHPNKVGIVVALIRQLEALDADRLTYKGLTAGRDRLIARLRSL